tara:strand:- start:160 stop:1779 length:1620 start_codon:yes stop_codon:yes gene_type:complete
MKNKIKFYLVVLACFCSSFLITKNFSPSVREISSALKISGVVFTKEQKKTMVPYVKRNQNAYLKMRDIPLNNNTPPAVRFSVIEERSKTINFTFNSKEVSLPKNKIDISYLTIGELSYLIKERLISSTEITKIYLERIKEYNQKLNLVVTLTEDLALKQALRADEEIRNGIYRGPLHGIPYGIKDLAAYPGYPTTWGATPYKNQIINEKALVIEKLEKAGAIMLCKLSSGSLARGDVWYGGKTKNPWDIDQGSSGSSAGSASAVAAGLVAFAIGTETLGSIISPSTRCGVTGLRPTFGSVSTKGFMTLSWSMDKVGPICRSARDCAIVYNYIKETKPDASLINFDLQTKNLKIGYLSSLFKEDTSRYSSNNNKTLEIVKLKYDLEKLSLPHNFPYSVFDIILRSEAGAFFDDFLLKNLDSSMVEQGERSRANSLRQSRLIPAVEYIQANRHREVLVNDIKVLFKNFDVILSPSFGKNQILITNLTGHPVVSLPNGLDEKGRPTSISVIGNHGAEDKILYFAEMLQNELKFNKKRPPLFN